MKAPTLHEKVKFRLHENGKNKKPSKMQQIVNFVGNINGQDILIKTFNSTLVIFLGWLSFMSEFVDKQDSTLIAIGLFILILSMAALNFATVYTRIKRSDKDQKDKQSNYKG